jgi:hypothetical protein
MHSAHAQVIARERPIPDLLHFISTWVPDLSAKHRIPPSSIPFFVPPPLRAIYELAGNWPVPYAEQLRPPKLVPGLFGTQDCLLPVDQLVVEGNRFTFVHENQGVWSCETLINEADPPVFSDSSKIDDFDKTMREVCPCVSHFLTTFCLRELAFGSQNLLCVDSEPKRPDELVNCEVQPLWLDGRYAYERAKYSFFLCDRELIIMCTDSGTLGDFWIAYNDPEASKLLGARHAIRRIH